MARETAKRSISPRTAMKLGAAGVIFLLGLVMGSGCSTGFDRETVQACLPITDSAALDACLGGTR